MRATDIVMMQPLGFDFIQGGVNSISVQSKGSVAMRTTDLHLRNLLSSAIVIPYNQTKYTTTL
jgi:hypothetical protein